MFSNPDLNQYINQKQITKFTHIYKLNINITIIKEENETFKNIYKHSVFLIWNQYTKLLLVYFMLD